MKIQHYSTKRRKQMNDERLKRKQDREQTWVRVPPLTKEQFEDGIRRARLTARFEVAAE